MYSWGQKAPRNRCGFSFPYHGLILFLSFHIARLTTPFGCVHHQTPNSPPVSPNPIHWLTKRRSRFLHSPKNNNTAPPQPFPLTSPPYLAQPGVPHPDCDHISPQASVLVCVQKRIHALARDVHELEDIGPDEPDGGIPCQKVKKYDAKGADRIWKAIEAGTGGVK